MAREYPRFLISNPSNTKSKGPFIIHTLPPQFICRVVQENHNQISDSNKDKTDLKSNLELLEIFNDKANKEEVRAIMNEMSLWLSHQKAL